MIRRDGLYVGCALMLVVTAAVALWIHAERDGQALVVCMVSIVGFCVALLALYVAVAPLHLHRQSELHQQDGGEHP